MSRRLCRVLVFALLVALAPTAGADVRRLEAVGTAPVRQGQRAGAGTRQAAVQAALREAVLRVARGLLLDAEPPEDGSDDGEEEVDLEKVLGNRMLPYTTRYRILEDKGERPAMFGDEAGVANEYVVVVEVYVEAERVGQRLVEAGLLRANPRGGESTRLRVEVRGLLQYPAYEAVRSLIAEAGGAEQVVPLEFERGVAVLEVDLPGSDVLGTDPVEEGRELVDRLVRRRPRNLTLEPVRVDEDGIVLSATWEPPPSSDADL